MARKLQSDKWLFLATLALVCVSVVMVYSASAVIADASAEGAYVYVRKQAMWAVLGVAVLPGDQVVAAVNLSKTTQIDTVSLPQGGAVLTVTR